MEVLEHAKLIALSAHSGQVDKGGNPYIFHPKIVASMVETDELKTVAWLHDVVEHTPVTIEDLKLDFPQNIVNAVDAITRRTGENRIYYLNRITKNPMALRVKIADLTHNSDLSRIKHPSPEDYARVERYKNEIEFLTRMLEKN